MPLTAQIRGPWFIPGWDESRDLNRWSQRALLELGQPARVVAKCSHCGGMVFATADGWVLVSFVAALAAGGGGKVVQGIRHFTSITDIGDAMAEHDV